jgi:mRNA-degrading endonuclease RelE of RelBE toxin-antitoxin system
LRIGRFRAFYDVDEEERRVSIEAIGFKIGHELFIRGERTVL